MRMIKPSIELQTVEKNPDIEPLDWIFLLNTTNAGKMFFRANDMPEILKTIMQEHLHSLRAGRREP
jgi:hypothetical protein